MGYVNKEDIPQEEKPLSEQLRILEIDEANARIDWRSVQRVQGNGSPMYKENYKRKIKRKYDRAVLALAEFKKLYPELLV